MKIDLHCHSYYSRDGISSPEKLIKTALKKGLDGIALTDHDTALGWEEAIEATKKFKAILILGQEIKIKKEGKTIGEILGYFLKGEINAKGKGVEEVIKEIKGQGGIAIIAHPYHWRKPFKELEKYKNLADGIEVFNSRSQTKRGNKKALDFAKKNNLPMTAGSDAHSCFEVGNAYLEAEVKNIEELKEAILRKEVKIFGKQSPIFVQIFATIGKLIHLFWRPRL
ncbi:MAG: PHP domain-containing protein [Patescibacteria group bacterium]|nr:PHP domain-containing protein [Patescibacteria group bacterium]